MRRLRGLALGALVTAILLVTGAGPAAAHDETGEFSAVRAEPTGDGLTVRVDVLLTYTNDGHGATDAVVSLTATGPADGPTPTVTMQAGDREGAYTSDLTLPEAGEWSLTVSAPDPEATRTFAVTVAEPATTTTAEPTTTTDEPAPTTTADDSSESEEGAPWWTALVFAGIGAVIGLLFVRWRNARKADPSP